MKKNKTIKVYNNLFRLKSEPKNEKKKEEIETKEYLANSSCKQIPI